MNIKDTIYEEFYNDLYNPDLKIRFMNENYTNSSESTKRTILNAFKKSARTEKRVGKDLCILNSKEIYDVAEGLGYITESSVRTALSFFSVYVDWCILNELRGGYENGINDIAVFVATQDLSKFISMIKNKHRYITKEEVLDIVDNLVNHPDRAIVLGAYEGITGKEMHELRSLKRSDINEDTNQVTLTDFDGKQRTIFISEKLKNILLFADSQEEYHFGNGGETRTKSKPFAESPYIIKPSARESNGHEMIIYNSLAQRFYKVRKYVGYDFVTIQSIQDSGQINRVVELTQEYGLAKPTIEIFKKLQSPAEYNLSDMQIYNLRQKYDLVINLKKFE